MSNYGHYTHQYYGNKINFPENSFKITGISFFEDKGEINYTTLLNMELENNKYDSDAIKIMNNNKQVGWVPKEYKKICKENLNQKLKIINIKTINNNIGVRVILENLYQKYDENLGIFGDS